MFVVLSPVALYPDLGAYSIFGVGILTLFYTGLLDCKYDSYRDEYTPIQIVLRLSNEFLLLD